MKEENEGRPMGQVIKIDEARIRDHLGEMVLGTVEETLNPMLDAEADELVGLDATSVALTGSIRGPAVTTGRCIRRLGK